MVKWLVIVQLGECRAPERRDNKPRQSAAPGWLPTGTRARTRLLRSAGRLWGAEYQSGLCFVKIELTSERKETL